MKKTYSFRSSKKNKYLIYTEELGSKSYLNEEALYRMCYIEILYVSFVFFFIYTLNYALKIG